MHGMFCLEAMLHTHETGAATTWCRVYRRSRWASSMEHDQHEGSVEDASGWWSPPLPACTPYEVDTFENSFLCHTTLANPNVSTARFRKCLHASSWDVSADKGYAITRTTIFPNLGPR